MQVYILCGIINLTRQMDPSPACIWLKRSLEIALSEAAVCHVQVGQSEGPVVLEETL